MLLAISLWLFLKFTSNFCLKTVLKHMRRTSAVDHVEFVRFVQRPAVIFTVIQIMPSKHTHHKTHLKQHTPVIHSKLLLYFRFMQHVLKSCYHADAVGSHVDRLVWMWRMLWDSDEDQTEGWRWWRVCTCVLHLDTSAAQIDYSHSCLNIYCSK